MYNLVMKQSSTAARAEGGYQEEPDKISERMMKVTRRWLLLTCGLLVLSTVAQAATIKTAEDLIAAMRKKYAKTWYKNTKTVETMTLLCGKLRQPREW